MTKIQIQYEEAEEFLYGPGIADEYKKNKK